MKIYIACPANCFTGGPTLLHQLCKSLSDRGFDSCMAYYKGVGSEPGQLVHPQYVEYGCRAISFSDIEDVQTNVLVLPETATRRGEELRRVRKVVWWLSVDNYLLGSLPLHTRIASRLIKRFQPDIIQLGRKVKKRGIFADRDINHLVQSEYARQFLKQCNVADSQVFFLSDYVEDEFCADLKDDECAREDVVLYNPKKLGPIVNDVIASCDDVRFLPLEGMNRADLGAALRSSKIYVDFGNHPGKDRLPREAAISGCCVITGLRGSAENCHDVPIPQEYKLDDYAPAVELEKKIKDVLANFEQRSCDFDSYRAFIRGEHSKFEEDLDRVCELLFETAE